MRIEVTAQDIRKGKKSNCMRCPVALAVKRLLPGHEVWADSLSIDVWTHDEYRRVATTPKKVATFMDRFDTGQPVKPFTFTMKEVKP